MKGFSHAAKPSQHGHVVFIDPPTCPFCSHKIFLLITFREVTLQIESFIAYNYMYPYIALKAESLVTACRHWWLKG